jgi:cell division protein FtsL
LTRIANLETFNEQIDRRMQERDEDLSTTYDQIDRLEKRFLGSIIVMIVMGMLITSAIVFKALRFLGIIPI